MNKLVHRATSLLVLPLLAAGAGLTVSVAPAQAVASHGSQVVSLTNAQRVRHGCPRLKVNAALTRAAGRHSWDMASRGYFSHTGRNGSNFVTRARAAGYRYAVGENIAWGQPSASAVVNAWMKSPGHRANILNCKARSVGVGMRRNGRGVPYWTQVFGRA
jgi:uncharacterized protein YkwD